MKKEYFAPQMEIVKIQAKQLLTASPRGFGDPVDNASGAEAPGYEDDGF